MLEAWGDGGYNPMVNVAADNFGIGEPTPMVPTLHAPTNYAICDILRPTLVVDNAVSLQSVPLSYRFEVYSDAGLSNLVSQMPAAAAGINTTAWQVDLNLNNNAQYWWRCRATDGTNIGPWMATATFFINEINNPPWPVVQVVSPSWVLANTNAALTWYPTTDPDAGDSILAYQLQVDDQSDFSSPIIDDANIVISGENLPAYWTISLPLGSFTNAARLSPGTVYYWRVRAQDSRFSYSAWPSGTAPSFAFGFAPPPASPTITRCAPAAGNSLLLEWTGASGNVFVEFKSNLVNGGWNTVAGPLSGTSCVVTPPQGSTSGFYRLRAE
jgi:hypothetical protein